MKNNNIIVMPVVRKRPWVNTDKYSKNKIGGALTTVSPYLGEDGFHTGLENDQELQNSFEKELGLVTGTLSPVLSNDYWHDNLNIRLEDGPTTFRKGLASDRLKLLILRNHPLVANSLAEISPDTDFYIVDEELETDRKATKAEDKSKAYLLLSEMSPSEKRQFLKMFGAGGNDMSDKDIIAELGDIIENELKSFLSTSEFSKEKVNIRAFIFDLVQYNILRLRGGNYFDSDEDKGNLEILTSYFLSPDKNDVYLNYKERLTHARQGS
jgi:hypothetical protein